MDVDTLVDVEVESGRMGVLLEEIVLAAATAAAEVDDASLRLTSSLDEETETATLTIHHVGFDCHPIFHSPDDTEEDDHWLALHSVRWIGGSVEATRDEATGSCDLTLRFPVKLPTD